MDYGLFSQYFNCTFSFCTCIVLSITYVSSLYVWNSQHNRDHPLTIRRRFLSVFVMMFLSPVFLYYALSEHTLQKASLWNLMGIKKSGILEATIFPLLLTMVLFLGPISMQICNNFSKIAAEPFFWASNIKSLIWWRNHIVAPISEEFTFRACMLPALLQCLQPIKAVFICPLFFGIAHFHHISERVKSGLDLKSVLFISFFQFFYTTIFGAYSAYLFYRTGHLMAPFIAHSFCNHMGFPDIVELITYEGKKKYVVVSLFFTGFILWCYMLVPLTEPVLFSNHFNWED